MDDRDTAYPDPTPGASLILSFRLVGRTTLVIGSGRLGAARAFAALEAESKVIVIAHGGLKSACGEVKWRAAKGQIRVEDWNSLSLPGSPHIIHEDKDEREAETLRKFLQDNLDINLVCVTDTILPSTPGLPHVRRTKSSAQRLYTVCRSLRVPVNTTDIPDLCDFTFASAHRFEDDQTGGKTCLQVAVTTNSQACRLAARLRREIVARLPKEVGRVTRQVSVLRKMAKAQSVKVSVPAELDGSITDEELEDIEESGEDTPVVPTPNEPVPLRDPQYSSSLSEPEAEAVRRRMKWVAQVSEYWPIPNLANMTEEDMQELLSGECSLALSPPPLSASAPPELTMSTTGEFSVHSINLPPTTRKGRILLVGSGPGHPSLLTVAAHKALSTLADLVLTDKLVPEAVLNLVPKSVQVKIARKFPGNAEGAQNELMDLAVEGARKGLTVVRLKQGDPSVYGRVGEEILFFRSRGFEPIVIPGVSSALAGPTFAGIPVTQRGVAESFVVCTGIGRNGKEIQLPGYQRSRTLLILMGVARLAQVVGALTERCDDETRASSVNGVTRSNPRRDGPAYPFHTPIAIIERASMPDQRAVVSTLKDIVKAMENVGEQRPPGMIVVGWSVLALSGEGDVKVLDEGIDRDQERVERWLGGCEWRLLERLAEDWGEMI